MNRAGHLLGRVCGLVAAAWAEGRAGWIDGYARQRWGPPSLATARPPRLLPMLCPDPSAHQPMAGWETDS